MRRLLTVLSCIALGAGVAACGTGTTPVSQRPVSHRPAPAGATTITHGATKNILLVSQTENVLFNLYSATHALATRAIPVSETESELRDLSDQATSISSAAGYELPAGDPARPLIVRSAKDVASAASRLRAVSLDTATPSQLLAVTDPLTRLRDDIGRVARHVTARDAGTIAGDLSRLRRMLAALPTSSGV